MSSPGVEIEIRDRETAPGAVLGFGGLRRMYIPLCGYYVCSAGRGLWSLEDTVGE